MKVNAAGASAHGIEGIECSSQVDVGEVEIGVVVANAALDSWWQGLFESLVKQWCFREGCIGCEVLV